MTLDEAKAQLEVTRECMRVKGADDIAEALDMAISALEIELLTDSEQRIFLKAMSREREVCQKVDDEFADDFADDDTNVSLVRVCNEIERKVKKIWE